MQKYLNSILIGSLLLAAMIATLPVPKAEAASNPIRTELLENNSFEDDLDSWEVFGQEREIESGAVNNTSCIRFHSTSGNNSSGIRQLVDLDVSDYTGVILSIDCVVETQRLSGTGWQGREAPVFVFVTYTDIYGVLHDQLPVYKGYYPGEDQSRRMYWHGFYILDPDSSSMSRFGTKVQPDRHYEYTVDLFDELSPRPKTIHYVGAGGSGWPERDGVVFSLSLIGF